MKAVDFPEANNKLLPPEGSDETVNPLPVWHHPQGGMVVSKWRISFRQRIQLLWTGHIWFFAWANTHPPISMTTEYPFKKADKDET